MFDLEIRVAEELIIVHLNHSRRVSLYQMSAF